ncbi:lytic transglycosylase domain-containing protein [Streptomyces sp. NPDC048270]|uniref:lytic transglycosylase domain-containing protein n=1 Tax=Streptomyces sp. NPDC048270 TaxID=3154615 RepID=UPI0033C66803
MFRNAARRLAFGRKAVATALVAAAATATLTGATSAHAATESAPQTIAHELIPNAAQFQAFNEIVSHESGWNPEAVNPSSGAYGLLQALPASQMASAGPDWHTDPATQIKWGLQYMDSRYGSPEAAWNFWQTHHWY